MKLRWQHVNRAALGSGVLCVVGMLLSAGCVDTVHVAAPPPPSTESETSPRTYDYKHKLRKVDRERRPVVALLRAGDIAQLKDYLPFGRTRVVVYQDGDQMKRAEVRGKADAPALVTAEQRLFLMRELTMSRDVVLVERERIFEIIRELEFGETKYAEKNTRPKLGDLLGVHYILEPAFFKGGSAPAQDSAWAELAKHATRRRQAEIMRENLVAAYLCACDVQTGHVMAVAYGAGETHAVAARAVVADLVDQLADATPPVRVIRFDKEGNPVLDIGSKEGVKQGDRFTVGSAVIEAQRVDPFEFIGRLLTGTKRDIRQGAVAHRRDRSGKEKPGRPSIREADHPSSMLLQSPNKQGS